MDTKRFNDNSISWRTEKKRNDPTIVSVKNSGNENVIVTNKKNSETLSSEISWMLLKVFEVEKNVLVCLKAGAYSIFTILDATLMVTFYLLVKHKLSICVILRWNGKISKEKCYWISWSPLNLDLIKPLAQKKKRKTQKTIEIGSIPLEPFESSLWF